MSNHGHFLDTPELPSGPTRFWLLRHAVVNRESRRKMYGALDVDLCREHQQLQKPYYELLAKRLPSQAVWFSSPLTRAKETAETIFLNGYGSRALHIAERFREQSLGDWHNTLHEDLPGQLQQPAHPFWSLSATERPPQGESMLDVCARVGHALDDISARFPGEEIVVASHGGAIRAAIAHTLKIHPETALHFCVQNLSLTILERIGNAWRLVASNEMQALTSR